MITAINTINLDELYAVLQSIRYVRPLPQTPLHTYLSMKGVVPNNSPAPLHDYLLTGWLTNLITAQYNLHRCYHNLPALSPTDSKELLVRQMQYDYQLSNIKLEAWSVIFIRYVCLTANISTHEHETIAQTTERTLRRRQKQGIKQVYLQILIDLNCLSEPDNISML